MFTLQSEYSIDFDVFGIISSVREYKLAYFIEKKLRIYLYAQPEIKIYLIGKPELSISNYLYEEDYASFRLLRNQSWERKSDYILPEMKQFDYLLLLSGEVLGKSQEEFLDLLKDVKEIQLLQKINVEKLKSKENLIFE